jgi:SAM-dependent methyltransferase
VRSGDCDHRELRTESNGRLHVSTSDDRSYGKSAHFYDLFDQKENIDFFYHYASKAGEVLDIGAGTGRIAIPLAERGVKVWCVEPSRAMRVEFKRKLSQRPDLTDRIRLIAGDAQTFVIDHLFTAAFLSGCFDHFLDNDERVESLRNIGRHMSIDGILVFDVFLGLLEDQPLTPAGVAKLGDREIQRYVGGKVLSDNTKQINLVFEVYRSGTIVERIEEEGLVGILSRDDLHRVLHRAGFEVRQEWRNYDFASYQSGGSLLIIEARKHR